MSGREGRDVAELAKRRGFFFPSNGVYGGVAGFYTYGPEGAALKRHLEDAWRDRFTVKEGNQEIEAPTIMPEAVFEASGHLDGFDDMLVECAECGESHRADHLIEDTTGIEDAEAIPIPEVEELIREHDLVCPSCGAALAGEPIEEFNLMFETTIGPGSGQQGYMRPETAQGIFVEFPQLAEYARNQLPFGVTQIGPAYRNEISPRKGVIRVREFTQAELEQFVDPERDKPDLSRVADVKVTLYPIENQREDGTEYVRTTIGDAVGEGIIANEWVAYYLGIAQEWYERVGVDVDRFRFRQHLPGERAHYASDCWDAEAELGGDWVEIAGFAYRGDYDLSKHAEHSGEDFSVFEQYDEPITTERATVDPDMSYLGPEFGGAAGEIADALERLAERDRAAFERAERSSADRSSGDEPRDGETVAVEVDGETHEIPMEKTGFAVEEVTESGEHVTPHVVEPSFGVGRTLYTLVAHAYREDEVDGEQRSYLSLAPEMAPTTVGVFPLMDRDGLGERAREIANDLREAGLEVAYDDSGNIGRRYRRQDEVGTPFCVTVDYETEGDGTVTLRDRDSTSQVRVPIADLAGVLAGLREGDRTFGALGDEYEELSAGAENAPE
ncbi:glycine--tRNA ligase [Halalkalicoccus sp. NIPERK01]|uniref:glycine--tRNA ligase n=1 Tax=Halalkalicoccus sp. NIPERK01 TaxID=3053469 RepID=UPI00256F0525|nr:glycine--tRNA ligase [Halalkalicoccus sp. NIPERK01]MDL5362947.1 glycine--tRNA ligase [Halalkalicoccus sp. NIPERK01]